MKLAWLTDIHLNFLSSEERQTFYARIEESNCDAILISGDIAEASSIITILEEVSFHIKKPIYFILGNHDYYKGNVDEVRKNISTLSKSSEFLYWLPSSGPQLLEEKVILVGQDGWADGRFGDYQNSPVVLNDSQLIADLFLERIQGKQQLLKKMQQLADKDAAQLENDLLHAISMIPNEVIILTHVPPFREACLYEGKISDDDYLPFFASKATGDVLTKIAKDNPTIKFLVLCGHTHSPGCYKPLDNLTVKSGEAAYYLPIVQEIISIPEN